MELVLLIDFGSTFTKLTVVDLLKEEIAATAKALTTVDTDIMTGFKNALAQVEQKLGRRLKFKHKFAASSAAGGLRMISIGVVQELTVKAARTAALKAGAKVIETLSYKLKTRDLQRIESLKPDILLLVGGTDGGNEEILVYNAKMLSKLNIDVPIVFAGNFRVKDRVADILSRGGKTVYVTENVMPKLNILNAEPARKVIHDVFIEKIIEAKGLEKADAFVDETLVPTPSAVLDAAKLLADGTPEEEGLGPLMLVDVGGATTDLYSIGWGDPEDDNVLKKGMEEPYAKRTVEGDLGVRYNARNLLQTIIKRHDTNEIKIKELASWVERVKTDLGILPQTPSEYKMDEALAKIAVNLAVERHVGYRKPTSLPFGPKYLQWGKDLTGIKYVVGTGGVVIHSKNPLNILKEAIYDKSNPNILKPKKPAFLLDKLYILSAMGLLSKHYPSTALRIMKKNLVLL
ncbi:MAG: hypothetical protein PWQ82_473 [Thermosediminibacterales bacterium]|nr:hypothetical protein [Thermosediminibacterales bacterium]